MDIIEILRRDLKTFATQTVFQIGTVTAVDKIKATCSVKLLEETEIVLEGVRLQAIDNEQDNGFLTFPKIDSSVVIGKLDNRSVFWVAMVSEVEEIIWKIDNKEVLKINASKITFNEGQKGAMVEIAKLKAQLNKAEQSITQLKNILTGWTPVPTDGGAALKAAISTWAAQPLTETVISDLENTNILL